ncbi:MAG: hypothetical protein OHK0022_55910 [Roseiflexaceae bacterium]
MRDRHTAVRSGPHNQGSQPLHTGLLGPMPLAGVDPLMDREADRAQVHTVIILQIDYTDVNTAAKKENRHHLP